MSQTKVQVSSKEMVNKQTREPQSNSVSRRQNPTSSRKLNANGDAVGSQSSGDKKIASKQNFPDSGSVPPREASHKILHKKPATGPVEKRQAKVSTHANPQLSKAPSENQSQFRHKFLEKSGSEVVGVSKPLARDQQKSSDATKQSSLKDRPKTKLSNRSKFTHHNTDSQNNGSRHVPKQEVKLSLPSKPLSKTMQADSSSSKKKHKLLQPEIAYDVTGDGDGGRLNRERTKTQTLNPEDSQLMTTLRHVAQQIPADIQPSDDAENYYEDDFEDYESDFEEASSLEESSDEHSGEYISKPLGNMADVEDGDDKEIYDYGDSSSSLSDPLPTKSLHPTSSGKAGFEEKKMDSGHYDLTDERHTLGKAVYISLDMNKTVLDKDHNDFQDISSMTQLIQVPHPSDSFEMKIINFAQAKRKQQERKASSKVKHRGEIILNMIRLDCVSLPLFDMPPVPYEVYMQSYGRSNTIQVSCQTKDDLMSEEVQTDEINTMNKWTQHPAAFLSLDDSLSHPVICAAGCDPINTDELILWSKGAKFNILELEKFILNTGQLMHNILEETSSGTSGLLKNNKADLGFSQGFIVLGTEFMPFLKNRRVSRICFVPHQPNSLLSVHLSSPEISNVDDLSTQMVKRCILCIWSLLQPSRPLKILVTNCDVTTCTFHPFRTHILFAGLMDGVLNVWDLKDKCTFQSGIVYENQEWNLKSPSYTTVYNLEVKHSSAVVGVQVLDNATVLSDKISELSPTQICSLDESGLCIIWTLLSSTVGMMSIEDTGVAPWGNVRLVQNESFSLLQRLTTALDVNLSPNIQFADLALDSADSAHILAAINTGHVAHGLSSGSRAHPMLYIPDLDGLSPAICICPCPFRLPYFLVGCGDGTIRLHARQCTRPLLSIAGSGGPVGSGPAIVNLQWSNCRPCIFFALDSESRLHVWDLASSDMYPMLTVPFKGKFITTMQLSPSRLSARACPYLALGTSCGKLKVHLVKDTFASPSLEETAAELHKFQRYVSIL